MEIINFLGNRFLKEGYPQQKFTVVGELKRPPFSEVFTEYHTDDKRIIAMILYKKFFSEDSTLNEDDKSLIERGETNKPQGTKIRLALSSLIEEDVLETSDISYIKDKVSEGKIEMQWTVETDSIKITSICNMYMPTTISIMGGILLFGKNVVKEKFFDSIKQGSRLYQNVQYLEKYHFQYSDIQKTYLTSKNYNATSASFYSLAGVEDWVEMTHVLFSYENKNKYSRIFTKAYLKKHTNIQICGEMWKYGQYMEMGGWLLNLLKFKEGDEVKCVATSRVGKYLFKRDGTHYFENKEGCIIRSVRIISI